MKTIERNYYEMCEEIDCLKSEVAYWKLKYEEERDINIREVNERIKSAQNGVRNALMFALSVKDNPDGSLSISKEDRKLLAGNNKQS